MTHSRKTEYKHEGLPLDIKCYTVIVNQENNTTIDFELASNKRISARKNDNTNYINPEIMINRLSIGQEVSELDS
jgi:hypothetical protein